MGIEITMLDQRGKDFLVNEEGISLEPYLDSVGIPTIGIGCTYYPNGRRVTMEDKPLPNLMAAWELFNAVNNNFLLTVYSTTRDDITQNQFNALVSLCYNIGPIGFKGSTVLKLVNKNPNDPKISTAFEMWKNAGGKPILLKRRKRECKLYFS
jgi:lysozyme